MKYLILFLFFIYTTAFSDIKNLEDDYFFVGKMESYNKDFTLYFKTREKAILSRGEDFNYITDYPQDLYIYNHKLKTDEPLITYEWFPSYVKKISNNYDYPVFPEDFAYYLMKDNQTLVMVSAIKNINQNFTFDIQTKKLNKYSTKGKLDFIVSSITKDCKFRSMNDTYQCNYYKPLISQYLIN